MTPVLSLILPANNEASHITSCLDAVLNSFPLPNEARAEIIVIPNGCNDDTAEIARSFGKRAQEKGWLLNVIELERGSKLVALNAADQVAVGEILVYLDADVIVSPDLLRQTVSALSEAKPAYASGKVQLSATKNWATRAYGRFYLQTPFMKQPAPGCGFFAMNRAGRTRWQEWPSIISDDTFARLSFSAEERQEVDANYEWPLVDGIRNLIQVRRRQNAGVAELEAKYPKLFENDSKERFTPAAVLKAVVLHPLGTLVYGLVSLTVKLTPGSTNDWRRGR
ncbi:glycosyltransferase family 2 protein [Planktotalea sp.]|uniref:glycosyltransferase family 2 protein n=1 Tax=Planktotalea sp. TaxID=2029877 RepID=UPI003D6A0AA1